MPLDRSQGFTQPVPTIVFIAALAASMLGLSHAVRTIPLGTAYAVWVGIGAALTVAWGVISGTESFSWAKILLIAGLVACVVGLRPDRSAPSGMAHVFPMSSAPGMRPSAQ